MHVPGPGCVLVTVAVTYRSAGEDGCIVAVVIGVPPPTVPPILGHHWLGCWPLMSDIRPQTLQARDVPKLAIAIAQRLQNAMAQCHIQWLYLAVHGCTSYLNLNLNLIAAV
jgi:hypothetical protein